jgi:hypothetical protein
MNIATTAPRQISLVTRLILVVALFSLSFTWLPTLQAPWPGDIPVSAIIVLTPDWQPDELRISGMFLPSNTLYRVQVRRNNRSDWFKLGTVQTDTSGQFYATFNMPLYLKGVPYARACIKDLIKGTKFCTIAYRKIPQ